MVHEVFIGCMLLAIVRQSILYLVKNVNFYFLLLVVYSFCVDVRNNWLVCSFIRTNIIFVDFVSFSLYFTLTFLVLYVITYFTKYTSSIVNGDWLILLYRYTYIVALSPLALLSYILDTITFYVLYITRLYSNSFIFLLTSNLLSRIVSVNYWYPLFKRHSYFGYFRSMRQRWGEVKSEEVNRIKY